MRLPIAFVALCLASAGCHSGKIELRSLDADLTLEYSCADFQPVATSEAETDLLEELAMTAYRHATASGNAAEAAHLPSLRHDRRFEELEPAIVEYFCDNPSALNAQRVPIVRPPLATNSVAPDFRLPALVETRAGIAQADHQVALSDFRGRVVVLHMLATWCPPCREEHQALIDYVPTAPPGVEFLTIVTHDMPGNAFRWLSENGGVPFTTLMDQRDRMANRYGIRGFPQLFIVAADGRIAHHGRGKTTVEELDEALSLIAAPLDATP